MLCKHNPAKRCTGNFAHKYWVGDKLLAKCEGTIMVELIDANTGERMTDEVQGMKIEVRRRSKLSWPCHSADVSGHHQGRAHDTQTGVRMADKVQGIWVRCISLRRNP